MEIKVKGVNKAFGTSVILDGVSFSLEEWQKVGLVGYNSTGKSTFLKIIAGLIDQDSGTVTIRKGAVLSYLPQDTSIVSTETVRDYLRRISRIADLEHQIGMSIEALAEYERRNGYAFDHKTNAVLIGLGLNPDLSARKISSLSSGQRSKIFLAGVLLSDADVFLLDEPTNNLDLPTLIWLEDFLLNTKSSCIIVSHDRSFLDHVTNRVVEIDWKTRKLVATRGKYSDYLERKEAEFRKQSEEFELQQKEIKRLKDQVRTQKEKAVSGSKFVGSDNDTFARGFHRDQAARSGRVAKSIEKRIERMDVVEKPVGRDIFRIRIKPVKPEGSQGIILKDVVAGYPASHFRVGPVSFHVLYGSRVLVLGLNGSGKSTLLKTISGELEPIGGEVTIGNALITGNLMQEHDNLPREESIKNFLMRRAGITAHDVYALVVKFGFKAEEIDKEISSLSPGGRARLLFALFSSLSVNVLLLDEPTNHLDLEALEAFEEAVSQYEGTIILVSHDRYFLEKFRATDTYILLDGKLERQQNLESYMKSAEREAKRLINLF
jgi:ATP-binding cassette subfamily F protein 3